MINKKILIKLLSMKILLKDEFKNLKNIIFYH